MQISKELLKGAAELIVLEMLSKEGELYGYQLVKMIASKSEDVFSLQQGTLYPLLYRLEDKGFVASIEKRALSGKMRRFYRITDQGQVALRKQKGEYETLVQGMRHVFKITLIS